MDRTRIWHVLVIVFAVALSLWFATPPMRVVLERRVVTEIEEEGKWVDGGEEIQFASNWGWLIRDKYTERRLVSESKEGARVERRYIEEEIGRSRIALGLDLRGGSELRYRMVGAGGLSDAEDAYARTEAIVKTRIDVHGLKEPVVHREGGSNLLVQIPGASRAEVERVKEIIEVAGTLEFRLVSPDEEKTDEAIAAGRAPRGFHLYEQTQVLEGKEMKKQVLVDDTPVLTGEALTEAKAGTDPMGRWEVRLALERRLWSRFERITSDHAGEPLAVVLNTRRERGEIVEPGTLYSAPIIKGAIPGGRPVISNTGRTIGLGMEAAEDLATILQSGSLPLGLVLEWESFVGPSLGEDSIRSSAKAIAIGVIAVLVFMGIYYMAMGLVANFAMCLDLIFIMGALGLFRATLTLPGIAGLILTVGMAVDANILISERIREEKARGGISLATAVKNGYQRAFVTILDANLTTLITALILYYVGTGPIKGFAITLSVGIVASMFSAVFVTRVIVNVLVEKGILRELRIVELVSKPNIPFMRHRKWAAMGSVAVVVVGLAVFFGRGQDKLGIDFTGGVLAEIALGKPMATSEVRDRIASAGLSGVQVQSVWAKDVELSSGGAKATHFEVRKKLDAGEEGSADEQEFLAALRAAFAAELQPEPFVNVKKIPAKSGGEEQEAYAGGTSLVMNLERPLSLGQVRAGLASVGFDDASVAPIGGGEDQRRLYSSVVLKVKSDKPTEVKARLEETFGVTSPFPRVEKISGKVAEDLTTKAYMAITFALVAIVLYIWIRFELLFGFAAVVALAHDVAIAVGVLAIVDGIGLLSAKFSLPIVAALLTIIGYSLNDTIVVFDRLRENLASGRRMGYTEMVNLSVNQTLSRTILTSFTTFLVVLVLFLVGGRANAALGGFAFALMVGIVVGTYSSIFVASALVVEWHKRRQRA